MRFIEELKKRKIAQWMAGYFAVAWGLLEVLSFLTNQFALPQFIVRSATVIVGTGFLVALTLAWHHGDKGRQHITGVETITLAVIVIAGGILTLIVNLPDSDDLTDLEGLGATSGPVTRMTIALPRDQRLGILQGGSGAGVRLWLKADIPPHHELCPLYSLKRTFFADMKKICF